jgi:hypothetical protein
MTPLDIAAIRARADAATKEPWAVVDDAGQGVVSLGDVPLREMVVAMTSQGRVDHASMGFIAAARTDVPALCDEVDRLRAAITQALVHFGECSIPAAEETLRAALGIPEGP